MWTIAGGIILAVGILYLAPVAITILFWILANLKSVVKFTFQLVLLGLLFVVPLGLLLYFFTNMEEVSTFIVDNEAVISWIGAIIILGSVIYYLSLWVVNTYRELVTNGFAWFFNRRFKAIKNSFSNPSSDFILIMRILVILSVPLLLWAILFAIYG